jgi:hypothetical protein
MGPSLYLFILRQASVCVCVCVEREREREREGQQYYSAEIWSSVERQLHSLLKDNVLYSIMKTTLRYGT